MSAKGGEKPDSGVKESLTRCDLSNKFFMRHILRHQGGVVETAEKEVWETQTRRTYKRDVRGRTAGEKMKTAHH